jgi:hypothetical protein
MADKEVASAVRNVMADVCILSKKIKRERERERERDRNERSKADYWPCSDSVEAGSVSTLRRWGCDLRHSNLKATRILEQGRGKVKAERESKEKNRRG